MRTSISDAARLRALIDAEALRAGFDAVAVTTPDAIPLAPARLAEFVADGFHGSMQWIVETLERRADPAALWPQVRSIVVLAMNYGPDHDPRAVLARREHGRHLCLRAEPRLP
jgi:epoxyqueuosine reductase